MRLSVEEEYRRYADRVFAAAFSVCRNRADADDVVQDTFLKYYTRDQAYESEEHLRAWLLRVAINRARDSTASCGRRNKVACEEFMGELTFAAPEDSRLFEAVMRLPDKYRVVVHLHYYEDYSVSEIARLLQSREGTVKSQLSRARALLKTMLKEEWDDDE